MINEQSWYSEQRQNLVLWTMFIEVYGQDERKHGSKGWKSKEDVFGVVDAQIGRGYGVWSTEYRERDRHTKRDLTTPGPTRAGTRPLAVPSRYGTIRPILTTTQEYYLLLFIHHGPIAQLTLHWPYPLFFWFVFSFSPLFVFLQVEVAPRWLNRVKASEPTFFFFLPWTRYLWRWYGSCYILLYIRAYGLAVGTAAGTAGS